MRGLAGVLAIGLLACVQTPARAEDEAQPQRVETPLPPGAIARLDALGPAPKPLDELEGLAYSADGTALATTGGHQSVARLWETTSYTEMGELRGHAISVWGLAFSPTASVLATLGFDFTIRFWDIHTQRERQVLQLERSAKSGAFSPDGTLFAARDLYSLHVWDVATGDERQAVVKDERWGLAPEHSSVTNAWRHRGAAFAPDGDALLIWNDWWLGEIWATDPKRGCLLATTADLRAVALALGLVLLAGTGVLAWRLKLGVPTKLALLGVVVALSALGVQEGTPRILRPRHVSGQGLPLDASFSPDGKALAMILIPEATPKLFLVDPRTGEIMRLLKEEVGLAVAYSPTGEVLAVAEPQGHATAAAASDPGQGIVLLDPGTGEQLGRLQGRDSVYTKLAFSPDGKHLASAARGGEVVIWDVEAALGGQGSSP
jgi:WD40 repeat protein